MLNSLVLDVAIGLVVVYFILSLICSVIIEGIAGIRKWRPAVLLQGIKELITETVKPGDSPDEIKRKTENATEIMDNFLKNPLFLGGTSSYMPSYIPSRSFALALLDSLKGHADVMTKIENKSLDKAAISLDSVDNIKHLVGALAPDNYLRKALLPLLESAGKDLDKAMANIEQWYDGAMARVTGWYKRWSQYVGLGLAIIVALALNADTFQISKTLYTDQTVRVQMVATAQELAKPTAAKPQAKSLQESTPSTKEAKGSGSKETVTTPPAGGKEDKAELDKNIEKIEKAFKMSIPLGWASWKEFKEKMAWAFGWEDFKKGIGLDKLFGILLTAFLVTLGSTFWFDLLNRLINFRSAGTKPAPAEPEKSKS